MGDTKVVWSRCNSCGRNTYQNVIHEHRFDSDPDDYRYTDFHMIISCNGCHNVSYRTESHQQELAYEDPRGWHVPVDIDTYPHTTYKKLADKRLVPAIVKDIYDESVAAYEQSALTLTGVGLRATIEAICNEQNIQAKNLESKINKLSTSGHISKNDAKRLHTIRFLGNDAAHEVVKPKKKSIEVALTLIEHLILTIYILDDSVAGYLDKIVDNFVDFESILSQKINEIEVGSELPIKAILKKELRRVDRNYDFTSDLNDAINTGKLEYLGIGKVERYNGSKDEVAHYVIKKHVS